MEATEECVALLDNFLQDTMIWCIMESGRNAEKDHAAKISTCHVCKT